jgi:Fimbrial assembly protein (PilN)
MKDINFIKTLSAKEQYALRKWSIFSFGMLGLVIIAITILQIPQLSMLNHTKKEHVRLSHNINNTNIQITQSQNLKNRMCCLGDQCKTIDTFACATHMPHTCMSSITNACTNGITLQTCSLQNKTVALTAQCANVQQATHFVQQLQKDTHFSHVQLASLQPASGNFVTFTIKGNIAG